ncbi:nicotinate-nucleotide adenylyltransferase [Helicovermis profundi]|uniref:Probable nicotinate-nucleotide adenylyltransferase n=1 Tax=Helicovermis profundi TaxID=3065157 RepID=A0AAU9EK07_9FIRM|nr:nicotinate-nucleotide adenylyltransferase [Clostridia bacterium S502]
MYQKNNYKVGIMGGTFDPIHYGHLVIAEQVRERFLLDKVIFVPVGKAPHKEGVEVDKFDRFNMVKLAIESNSNFEISSIEIDKHKKTYTIDTIKELKNNIDAEIFFITGSDAILMIDTWKDYKELLSLVKFIGATRPGVKKKQLENKINEIYRDVGEKILLTSIPKLEISSTDIRRRVKNKKSIKYLLPEKVEEYIYSKSLYLIKK